ncbi:MAG: hypothetical protein OHK0013_47540 [Sandaracinaceae bacterium]
MSGAREDQSPLFERTTPAVEGPLSHGVTHPLLAALYAGRVFQRAPSPATERLVSMALAELEAALGARPREALARMGEEAHFAAISRLRRVFYLEAPFHEAVLAILDELGLPRARVAFDPLRLRVIQHRGHENEAARAVYYPHRDTWYGHPQGLVTGWVPLDDLDADETFVLHPDELATPVPNDSETFDYDSWVAQGWGLKIGWQSRRAGIEARYPGVTGPVAPRRTVGFACRRAELLLFSGAHFHRTLPQARGRTRFSLDFRFVDLDDHARGVGAPNVDNRSTGSALIDYVRGDAALPGAG